MVIISDTRCVSCGNVTSNNMFVSVSHSVFLDGKSDGGSRVFDRAKRRIIRTDRSIAQCFLNRFPSSGKNSFNFCESLIIYITCIYMFCDCLCAFGPLYLRLFFVVTSVACKKRSEKQSETRNRKKEGTKTSGPSISKVIRAIPFSPAADDVSSIYDM